jgi:uncharacterized secreted protein with C-terminal beta-propeller domain
VFAGVRYFLPVCAFHTRFYFSLAYFFFFRPFSRQSLVFFMQTGFAMLEVGCVDSKNTRNILLKNVLDASLGAIVW